MRKNIKTYQSISVESVINTANPHTIISMLFDGIFKSLSITRGAIERKDLSIKSSQLNKAISILRSLQDSLDTESQPKISEVFYDLYTYCIDRLMEVSASLNCSILDDVVDLLKPVADAWKEISEADKKVGFELLREKNN